MRRRALGWRAVCWCVGVVAMLGAGCGGDDPPPAYPPQPPPAQGGYYQGQAQPAAAPGYGQPAAAPGYGQPAGPPDPRQWLAARGLPVPPNCRVEASRENPSTTVQLLCPDASNSVLFVFRTLTPQQQAALRAHMIEIQRNTVMESGGQAGPAGEIPCTLPGGRRGTCSLASGTIASAPFRVVAGYVPDPSHPAFAVCFQVTQAPGAIPPCPLLP